jgi:hypothetical protein
VHAVVQRRLLAERGDVVVRKHRGVERVHALPRRGGRVRGAPEELDVDALVGEAGAEGRRRLRAGAGMGPVDISAGGLEGGGGAPT